MRRAFFSLVIVITCVFAAGDRPGATYLLLPPTAKATGMGYAWTAIADDASANYYNAAGLAFLESPTTCATYFNYLPGFANDMHYVYIAAGIPHIKYAWGFDIMYFSLGKTEVTNELGEYIDTYYAWRSVLRLNYAKKIFDNLSGGIGLKWIIQVHELGGLWFEPFQYPLWYPTYHDGTGSTWAVDFNILYKILPYLCIGSVVHDLGPRMKYTGDGFHPYRTNGSDPLPLTYRLGVAFSPVDNKYFKPTLSAEITKVLVGMFADKDKSFLEQLDYELTEAWKGIGLEFTFFRVLSLRGGHFWDMEGARRGFTYGGGVKINKFELDIGIDENIFDFPTTNRKVSLSYTF